MVVRPLVLYELFGLHGDCILPGNRVDNDAACFQ